MSTLTAKESIAALNKGIDLRSLDKTTGNTFQQNVIWRNGSYHTRPGAGLLARYSSTLTGGRDTDFGLNQTFGYSKLLGAYIFITDQGHTQILTVHGATLYTGNVQVQQTQQFVAGRFGQTADLFVCNIYDATSDSRLEFPLYRSTAERGQGLYQLPKLYPQMQSSAAANLADFVNYQEGVCSFSQVQDNVYFTVPGHGLYVYRPIDPAGYVDRKLGILPTEAASYLNFYGESSVITKVLPSQGFVNNITYYTADEVPSPVVICNFENRLVYASGRYLYFSDADFPQHILAENVQPIPTERDITAVATVRGVILIWTATETWLYQPVAAADLISGGRIYNLSRNVGCLGPNLVAAGPDNVFWVDQWGVHTNNGGTDFTTLSAPIEAMFTQDGELQNPLTSYYANSGVTDLAFDQPKVVIDIRPRLSEGNIAWDDRTQVLYVTTPNGTLVYQPAAGWSYWTFETSAHNFSTSVEATTALNNPTVLTSDGRTFLVSSPDNATVTDDNWSFVDGSFSILELGRGGSLDKSSAKQEDRREVNGSYQYYALGAPTTGTLFVDKPILLPANYNTGSQSLRGDTWLIPIYLHNSAAVDVLDFRLQFNNSYWKFVQFGAVGVVDYIVPNERVLSVGGYRNGTGEVRIYDNGTGLPSATGNELRITFDGAAAPATWAHAPFINLNPGVKNPLLYVLVQRVVATAASNSLAVFNAVTQWPLVTGGQLDVYLWNQGSTPTLSMDEDAQAQPQDWAIKTAELGDGKQQLKCRGAFLKLCSHGEAVEKTASGWLFGPVNTLTTSDYRDYSGQIADFTSTPEGIHSIVDKESMRARIKALPTSTVLSRKIGRSVAKWGSVADPTKGNLLIDNPAVDTVATSEGVRGEQFSTMVYGTLNNPAESIKIQNIELQTRVVGGRRRGGR